MASEFKVSVKSIYKIFGSTPMDVIARVKSGINKQELLEKHDHVLALNNVNLDIRESTIQVIMGLSGSGKSTLIRHFNGLIEPTVGEIFVDDKNIINLNEKQLRQFRRFRTSMVFQKFALFPHRTVEENVGYGLMIQGQNKKNVRKECERWINRVGLNGFEAYYPSQLSGGMQQRVGLARALATDPDILLMDEPFSALDPLIREEMQDILIELQVELKKTILFITHDLDEALRLGDKVAILRDGAIVQDGKPQEIILSPSDDYVADFTKNINRGRVLTVGSILNSELVEDSLQVDSKTSLEETLRMLIEANRETALVTHKSKPIGSVGRDGIVLAMTQSHNKRSDSVNYI